MFVLNPNFRLLSIGELMFAVSVRFFFLCAQNRGIDLDGLMLRRWG